MKRWQRSRSRVLGDDKMRKARCKNTCISDITNCGRCDKSYKSVIGFISLMSMRSTVSRAAAVMEKRKGRWRVNKRYRGGLHRLKVYVSITLCDSYIVLWMALTCADSVYWDARAHTLYTAMEAWRDSSHCVLNMQTFISTRALQILSHIRMSLSLFDDPWVWSFSVSHIWICVRATQKMKSSKWRSHQSKAERPEKGFPSPCLS